MNYNYVYLKNVDIIYIASPNFLYSERNFWREKKDTA